MTRGIGICGALGIAFVILKLTHMIEWPWIWVTLPFWGGFVFTISIVAIALVIWAKIGERL